MYGRDGRDSKKVDTKSILFDFEFFQHLSQKDFIFNLNAGIHQFTQLLNENRNKGNFPRILSKVF